MSKCTITFDQNPLGVYYAGQVVSGTAELITNRPKTIRSIYISVSGYAEVRWNENIYKADTHGEKKKALETYSGSELYYSVENYVYGQSGGAQMELPASKYVFPFQATIPPNAPTSYNGSYGKIQHEVTVVIDRVMRYNNTFKQPYSVLSPYDLNLNPENAKALHKIDEKTFWWTICFGRKAPMVMEVNVPYSSYAPGQKIRFNVVLDNQSNINCSDMKVRLMKRTVFTSRSPETKTQVTEVKVADSHCGEVAKLNKAAFNEFLQIPATTPTSLESCSMIKISYTLKFIAKVLKLHGTDLIIEFPIAIGTVPLHASITKPLPTPSFEEDVRSEQFESNTFKPRYPVYLENNTLNNTIKPSNSNLYPITTTLASPEPTKPRMPAITPNPSAPAAPTATPPYPVTPLNNPSASAAATATPPYPVNQMNNNANNLEVLGFSLPPGYQPTPSKPAQSAGIGWK